MSRANAGQDGSDRIPGAAAAQYRGYALQTVRVCDHLFACDEGDRVWLEHYDDTGIEKPDRRRLLEQVKSASSHNPVSDGAEDLWKTMAHWVRLAETGRVDPARSVFRLYVVQPYTGILVRRLHEARSDRDVQAIVTDVTNATRQQSRPPSAVEALVERFLCCDASIQSAIVRNFEFATGNNDPIAGLRWHLRNAVAEPMRDVALDSALGWVKRRIEEQLQDGKTVWIEARRFKGWLSSWLRRHDRDHVLASLNHQPTTENIETELRIATYIRQLEAIECSADEKMEAASDYLRARADRTFWSEKGFVIEDSLTAFDTELEREWKRCTRLGELSARAGSDADRGKALYYQCLGYRTTIDGRCIPQHLVPGGLHNLADDLIVGWHRNFATLIVKKGPPRD